MKTTEIGPKNDFFFDTEMVDEVLKGKESWDPDEDRRSDPEQEYMRGLLYDAKRWKKAGQPEFEKRVLIALRDFLQEYIQVL